MGLQDDNLAIVELTARYNQVIDGGFADRVEEVFTPDARFSSPAHGIERQGTAEIAEMALGSSGHFGGFRFLATGSEAQTQHNNRYQILQTHATNVARQGPKR